MLLVLKWIKDDPDVQMRIISFLIATLGDREDFNSEQILSQIFVQSDSEVTLYRAVGNQGIDGGGMEIVPEDQSEGIIETEDIREGVEEEGQEEVENQSDLSGLVEEVHDEMRKTY